jgi:hypothetical protein
LELELLAEEEANDMYFLTLDGQKNYSTFEPTIPKSPDFHTNRRRGRDRIPRKREPETKENNSFSHKNHTTAHHARGKHMNKQKSKKQNAKRKTENAKKHKAESKKELTVARTHARTNETKRFPGWVRTKC